MHSPHPYLAAVGSYRRWYSVLILVLFLGWIATFAFPRISTDPRASQMAGGSISLQYPQFLMYCWFLGILGVVLVTHLKAMLGSPASRIMPALVRAHLLAVWWIVAFFVIVVPLAMYWGLGFRGAAAALVAMALVAFSVAALVTFRRSWAAFLVFYAPTSVGILDRYWHRDASWTPTIAGTVTLFALAIGCLAILAVRFAKFHEEMPEYARRIPTTFREQMSGPKRAPGPGGTTFPVALPRNLRAIGHGVDASHASLLQRALHWHAAWRSVWSAAAMGTFYIVFFFGLIWTMFGIEHYVKLFGNPMNLFFSVFPAMIFAHPRNRSQLVQEWMRPWSRTQYVRAVGITLAVSCAICWFITTVAPLLAIWFLTSENPLNSSLQQPLYLTIRQQLAISLCVMPPLFGAVTWPYKHVASLMGTVIGMVAGIGMLSIMLAFNHDRLIELPTFYFYLLLGGLLTAGLSLTYRSYRRWLAYEVIE